ncbi:photosynthetic reaction center cytochrome c subunit [Sphingomonas kaistensis]|uniref:Photosynthetic reaction center cytochrome c subunit n=1 Tax=Sphingomonas kaistensis TaxID=298708 RepID=A0A7X5Y6B7_9SPHN|nr:photosynthetic reaction center cytochrome PufC [Sphingomonas kaistensis]NJC05553.1 photosynthetic reaction center cytochrome c subunit [Sphingomonas kaistensis]
MTNPRLLLVGVVPLLALSGCELGSKQSTQTGYRGTGMDQITDVSSIKAAAAIPAPPYPLSAAASTGPRVQGQNIQVLNNLSEEEFGHLMSSISLWVAGDAANCQYCHNPANMADDSVYTKKVARQMLKMTMSLNSQWSNHTGQTGVTCYTCHRGQPVPEYVWSPEKPTDKMTIRGQKRGQNTPDANVGYASLPTGVFEEYLGGNAQSVRVAASTAYPGSQPLTTRDAENSYAIMMHVSKSLGVNCTFCHNSQSFRSWSLSSAQRATAWYGIRMVRDINGSHISPLARAGVFPPNRLGPTGAPLQVNCLTCHQGVNKPLGGVSMIKDYPYLRPAGYNPQPRTAAEQGVVRALQQPAAMTGQVSPPNAPNEVDQPAR